MCIRDSLMRQREEVDEDNLDYHDNIEEYGPVSDEQLKFFADRAEAVSYTHLDVYKRQVWSRAR